MSPRTLSFMAVFALAAGWAAGQDIKPVKAVADAPPGATTVVVAGKDYAAGPLQRWLFGATYRKVWTTPVRVEIFDFDAIPGLKPKKTGGGFQTLALHLEAGDGREFRLRSVDKDPEKALPEEFQDTLVEEVAQDQISASHPAGVLVVDSLSDAVGLRHVEHKLVVIPDDPRLGEFRKKFAGLLAMFEPNIDDDKPLPRGLEGLEKIVDTEELYKLLDRDPAQRIDERAFLRARLFDLVIGDWDRHEEQWEWALFKGNHLWQPVPKDRDQAFTRYDGLILTLAGPAVARQLVSFGERHSPPVGMHWNGRIVDRRLLGGLGWPAWEEATAEVQKKLTDEVIAASVRRMPPEYHKVSGPLMVQRLKARRDTLPGAARRFYDLLATEVEVHGTDLADLVELDRVDGTIEVRLTSPAVEGVTPEPRFRRIIHPDETDEIRLFLKGGDDRAVSRGEGSAHVVVRFVGEGGRDVADDTADIGMKVYDTRDTQRVNISHLDSKPFQPKVDRAKRPLRDWGSNALAFSPTLRVGHDMGVFAGVQARVTDFGWRKYPYHYQHTVSAGYATGLRGARAEYFGDLRGANSPRRINLLARFSQTEFIRFHGFGNETEAPGKPRFYRVPQDEFLTSVTWRLDLRRFDLYFGPVMKYTTTELAPDRFITSARPYGSDNFGQAGLTGRLRVDGRDHPGATTKGALFEAGGSYYPKFWDVASPFGEAHGQLSTYVPLPLRTVLALRAGGQRVWGDYPFHEAAYLGGGNSIRGLRRQRYAGDAAAWGNAELRLRLGSVRLLVPTRFGVFGLADAGRVWLEGETSDRWHHGVGGGVWWSFLKPEHTLALAVARSNEETRPRIYVQGGFAF